MRWKGIFVGLAGGLVAGLALGAVRVQGEEGRPELLVKEFFRPLAWLVRQVEQNYVEEVDRLTLLEGAYQGMLSKADSAGAYLPAEMVERYGPGADGTIPELGMTVRLLPLKKAIVVDGTIPGKPAFQAGILGGDYIVKVSEASSGQAQDTGDFRTDYDAVRALRGDVGTDVTLTVLRLDDGGEKEVKLTRSLGRASSVRLVEMADPEAGIGYLAVTDFDERTTGQLLGALAEFRHGGARGVIIDLRFSPGGLLDSAAVCADLLLSKGVILGARGRSGKEATQEAEEGEAFPEIKLALLVNGYTAGAAEVMAAALADNDRADLVGQKTLGRGSMRTAIHCPYDGSTIKLAIAHYLRPNGEEIEGKGIKPDLEVELPTADVYKLAAHLAGKFGERTGRPLPAADETAELPFADGQLERALEQMRAILAGERNGEPAAVGPAPVREH